MRPSSKALLLAFVIAILVWLHRCFRHRYDSLASRIHKALLPALKAASEKSDEHAHISAGPKLPAVRPELTELRRLLVPLSFDAELGDYGSRFVDGTRGWVFDDLERWRRSATGSRCRVLLGGPGFGKTAIVARLCATRRDFVLGVHLCRHNDAQKRDPKRMVRGLAYQIAQALPSYRARLEAESDSLSAEIESLSIGSLVDRLLLQPLVAIEPPAEASSGRLLLVVDAVDEAEHDQRNELLDAVARDFSRLPPWMSVLVTSRPELPVRRKLAALRPTSLDSSDHAAACDEDVLLYLRAVLATHVPPADLDAAIAVVARKASRLFLYLHWLRMRLDARDASRALALTEVDALPEGLAAEYEAQLRRVFPRGLSREAEAQRVLRAIIAAAEPPHIEAELPSLSGVAPRACLLIVSRLSQLFPVHDDLRVHVFHKARTPPCARVTTFAAAARADRRLSPVDGSRARAQSIVDWLTGSAPYDARTSDEEYLIQRAAAHRQLAAVCCARLLEKLDVHKHESDRMTARVLRRIGTEGADPAPDGYSWRWACYHLLLASGAEASAAQALLCSATFLLRRVRDGQLQLLLGDTESVAAHFGDKSDARLVDEALVLSRTALAMGASLAQQLWQRLAAAATSATSGTATTVGGALVQVAAEGGVCALHRDFARLAARERLGASAADLMPAGTNAHARRQHTNAVSGIASFVLPTGEPRIASASFGHTVLVWDPSDAYKPKLVLEGHHRGVHAVAPLVLEDGSVRLLTGSRDKTIRVWDAAAGGSALLVLEGHSFAVFDVACCEVRGGRPPRAVSVAGGDKALRLWDPVGRSSALATLEGHTDWVMSVACFCAADGGQRAVSGSSDRTLRIWDLERRSTLAILDGHRLNVRGVTTCTMCDGEVLVVSCAYDASACVWRLPASVHGATEQLQPSRVTLPLTRLEGHGSGIRAVASCTLDDGAAYVVTASHDHTARVWATQGDPERWALVSTLHGHHGSVSGVACVKKSNGGFLVMTSSFDCTLRSWDVRAGSTELAVFGAPISSRAALKAVDFDTAGSPQRVAYTLIGTSQKLLSRRCADGVLIEHIGHDRHVSCAAFFTTADGAPRLVTGSWDRALRVWDAADGSCLTLFEGHGDAIQCLDVVRRADGTSLIISGSEDRTARVWDAETGEASAVLREHENEAWAVAHFVTSSGLLRFLTVSGCIRCWDWENERVLQISEQTSVSAVRGCALPDGRACVLVSCSDKVVFWDPESNEDICAVSVQSGDVFSAKLVTLSQRCVRLFVHAGGVYCVFDLDARLAVVRDAKVHMDSWSYMQLLAYQPARIAYGCSDDGKLKVIQEREQVDEERVDDGIPTLTSRHSGAEDDLPSAHIDVSADVFISLRFAEAGDEALQLKTALEAHGVVVFVCDQLAGNNLMDTIYGALDAASLVVILASHTYGKRTASGFSTYEEFQYTMDEKKPFFLIKMCERWSEPHVRGQLGARTMFDQWMPGEPIPAGLERRVIARLQEVQGVVNEPSRRGTP